MSEKRRRIDQILDPAYTENLPGLDLGELRARRQVAADVESELSYYRRILHGRMDLLNFELARRRGDEKRSLIEALPEILAAGERAGGQTGRVRGEFDLALAGDGNRPIDAVLQDDFLTHVYDLEVSELEDILTALTESEREVSETRRAIQAVFDQVQQVISNRYRETVVGELSD